MTETLKFEIPPLGLYIHFPWCVHKCPYCDFNSYARPKDEKIVYRYIKALGADIRYTFQLVKSELKGRVINSIYLGGGTPSLYSPADISGVLSDVIANFPVAPDCEISMEVNPGTVDANDLEGFKLVGINRLSIGVQSFHNGMLKRLKRIHDSDTAIATVKLATEIFDNVNVDLIHSLPGQTTKMALQDLSTALELGVPHISWYQLTIEEDTKFGRHPPLDLPSEEVIEETVLAGSKYFEDAGYKHYEVSAFAKPGKQCRHNVNYWRFGDYLAVGAGAHGKFTLSDGIVRYDRYAQPIKYIESIENWQKDWIHNMDIFPVFKFASAEEFRSYCAKAPWLHDAHIVPKNELSFEYFLNRFRLFETVPLSEFKAYTGLEVSAVAEPLSRCVMNGLIVINDKNCIEITSKGHLFVNKMLEEFL